MKKKKKKLTRFDVRGDALIMGIEYSDGRLALLVIEHGVTLEELRAATGLEPSLPPAPKSKHTEADEEWGRKTKRAQERASKRKRVMVRRVGKKTEKTSGK